MKTLRAPDEILGPIQKLDFSTKSQKRVAFTGTRDGMTDAQACAVAEALLHYKPSVVHHGDCIGADAEFHDIARSQGIPIEIHPPNNPTKRAFCGNARKVWPEMAYLRRNQTMVLQSDLLIAAPREETEVLRSGTWSTVRSTRSNRLHLLLVLPNGRVVNFPIGYTR